MDIGTSGSYRARESEEGKTELVLTPRGTKTRKITKKPASKKTTTKARTTKSKAKPKATPPQADEPKALASTDAVSDYKQPGFISRTRSNIYNSAKGAMAIPNAIYSVFEHGAVRSMMGAYASLELLRYFTKGDTQAKLQAEELINGVMLGGERNFRAADYDGSTQQLADVQGAVTTLKDRYLEKPDMETMIGGIDTDIVQSGLNSIVTTEAEAYATSVHAADTIIGMTNPAGLDANIDALLGALNYNEAGLFAAAMVGGVVVALSVSDAIRHRKEKEVQDEDKWEKRASRAGNFLNSSFPEQMDRVRNVYDSVRSAVTQGIARYTKRPEIKGPDQEA